VLLDYYVVLFILMCRATYMTYRWPDDSILLPTYDLLQVVDRHVSVCLRDKALGFDSWDS